MKNWFREDGGPAFYGYSNRTSVTGDINIVVWCLVFLTVFLAFLIIFPGIRKERFATFITVSLSLFVGNVIMVSRLGSSWHVAKVHISSSYSALTKELITAELGVYIGLGHANITLRALPKDNLANVQDIDFNERFSWLGAHEMGESYHEALIRGLPFPILTVAEYFSLRQEGFTWGGQYRAAGYYGSIMLWAAFASWLMMNLLLIVVPRYGAYAMMTTGLLLIGAASMYQCLLPINPLTIRFEENKQLEFGFGWCFWLVHASGAVCLIVGLIIVCIDCIYPHKFSTVLEVDYDTPFDRHIIIEDSHYHRKKRTTKNNEQVEGLGRRILRRLSSKKDDEAEGTVQLKGVENRAFEADPPNSPWRYPYNRPAIKGTAFKRTLSQDSASSTASSNVIVTFTNNEHPTVHTNLPSRYLRRFEAS